MTEKEFNKLIKNVTVDRDSLIEIYNFYYKRIIYFLSRRYPLDFSEDCAQDFFVNLLKKPIETKIENPTAWVYRCCLNIASNKIAKENKYTHLNASVEVGFESSYEVFGELYEKLNLLEENEIEIIHLVHWQGYNLKEVAQILGLSHVNARKKYSRIIKKLKRGIRYEN